MATKTRTIDELVDTALRTVTPLEGNAPHAYPQSQGRRVSAARPMTASGSSSLS